MLENNYIILTGIVNLQITILITMLLIFVAINFIKKI